MKTLADSREKDLVEKENFTTYRDDDLLAVAWEEYDNPDSVPASERIVSTLAWSPCHREIAIRMAERLAPELPCTTAGRPGVSSYLRGVLTTGFADLIRRKFVATPPNGAASWRDVSNEELLSAAGHGVATPHVADMDGATYEMLRRIGSRLAPRASRERQVEIAVQSAIMSYWQALLKSDL